MLIIIVVVDFTFSFLPVIDANRSTISIESIVRITGIASYMLIRCPILGGCALTVIPVVAMVNKIYGNWLSRNATEVQDALAAANDVAQETFACIRTVIAFASENLEYQKYTDRIDCQYRLQVRQVRHFCREALVD